MISCDINEILMTDGAIKYQYWWVYYERNYIWNLTYLVPPDRFLSFKQFLQLKIE